MIRKGTQELTIANPYKGRLETIQINIANENTTFFDGGEVAITDYNNCLLVRKGYSYPVIIYDVSRADIGNDLHKAIQLSEEIMLEWGCCQPELD